MNHEVKLVGELHESARSLYDNVVVKGDASAETMLEDLNSAVNNLKENWKGADAGLNIQRVIEIHNILVKVRNDLASLACDASKIAANYREIQITNGVDFPELEILTSTDKSPLEEYINTDDTIYIQPEADQGRVNIESVVNSIDTFIANVQQKYDEIMSNWTKGTGREVADESFHSFLENTQKYKNELNNVAESIANALKNYSF